MNAATNKPGRKTFACLAVFAVVAIVAHPTAAAPSAPETAARIDRLIVDELFTEKTELAPTTNDTTFLRRVSFDLVGDLPTPEDIAAFVLDPSADKRARVVARLLDNPQFGQNWARYWRDVILYRRVEERAALASNAVTVYLAEKLNNNTPWDKIATEFITATGDVRENGATSIYFAQDGRTEETTAEFSRVFLGMQLQCAQCHDHPYDQWKREQFHELAAFFPRVGVRPVRSTLKRSFAVIVNDRPNMPRRANPDNANRRGVPEHYMSDLEDPSIRGTLMEPKFFLTGQTLPLGSTDAKRRKTIARWLTNNEWFAKAFVNRMWAEMVGVGFFDKVDDIGPEREPTAGDALDVLAEAFVENGYDVQWLMRVICLTDAYQREVRPRDSPIHDVPFAANVAQPLRADQLFNALLSALEIDETEGLNGQIGAAMGGGRRRGGQPRDGFNVAFGYDPSDARDEISASIPQVLAMMNSPVIAQAILGRSSRTMLGRLLKSTPNNADVTYELYLRCLAREPSENELSKTLAYVKEVDDRRAAFEDVLWALLNSAEFKFRR